MSESDYGPSSDDDFSPMVRKTTSAKVAKPRGAAGRAAKSARAVMQTPDRMDMDEESSLVAARKAPGKSKSKTAADGDRSVEEIYQKKTQLEHILLRPDTYIGSAEPHSTTAWVLSDEGEFVNRQISFVPGLFKIFDEILVNAADNKIRDPKMDALKVTIDAENNTISVWNNGRGIPIQIHKEEGIYVPELIFGHLLTSSNYNDEEKKVTGGRNGFGAKLCNIFSNEFIVETADRELNLKYKQVFSKNMSVKSKPSITENKRGEEFTKITFKPDLAKFKMPLLDKDIIALLKKRVYDMAGCCRSVKVYLNNERIKIRDFKSYVSMYIKNETPVIYENVNDRWEVAVSLSDDQFQQMSFVNSICTSKGGTHVDYVTGQIVNKVIEAVKKKNKSAPIKPFQVRNQLWVFVNCLIENPSFDSQTKENMTLRMSSFGSKCDLSEDFMKKVLRSGVVDKILDIAASKQEQMLKKTDGRKNSRVSGILKLDDANNAGTRNAKNCTLILTEGDSAKALAVSGLGVVGRDNYGVFPLRGKLLNVRDAPLKSVSTNTEIQHLKQILGLQQGKSYADAASLRYGHVMIMTDQDHDGSHIKGLIINFFDHYWPSLLKIPGFLCEFITPIVKCSKGSQVISFFTIPEYEQWRDSRDTKGWHIKYYKGLGTSTRDEAKKYFSALPTHRKAFEPCNEDDRKLIDMAFNKKKADERKNWLATYIPGTFMDHSQDVIPIQDFVNKELMLFSIADNHRSIPSMVDGLKPGQRKILFACFKRNLRNELKVVQLAGYVSEHSAYHHGDQSLWATIINMAQDFVGSNNINLLEPRGQFGTRLQGGQDAASARYIFTTLSPLTRRLYHAHDDALLKYLDDDGQSIEPEWYMPVLPMVLINGSQGIGTGWSSTIPNYNPLEVLENVRRLLRGEQMVPMSPWYRGFKGTIEPISEDRFKVSGIVNRVDDVTLEITELPVGTWTQSYKAMLEEYLTAEKPCIKDYKEYHTDTSVHFIVTLTPEMAAVDYETLEKKFKFTASISTSNMVCFDPQGRIKKYRSAADMLEQFFHLRLSYYGKRKEWLTSQLLKEFTRLENKMRFIREVISRNLIIERKKKADLVAELRRWNYLEIRKGDDSQASQASEDAAPAQNTLTGFDYLLSLPLYSLTEEKVVQLEQELLAKKAELDHVLSQSPEDMWNTDLDSFIAEWEESEERRLLQEQKGSRKGAVAKGKGKRAAVGDESDEEYVAPKRAKSAPKKALASSGAKKATSKSEPGVKVESGKARAGKTPSPVVKDEEGSPPPDVKPPTVTTTKPKRATAAKKKKIIDDSESDSGSNVGSISKQSSLDNFFSAVTRKPPGIDTPRAAVKPEQNAIVKPQMEGSDEEDDLAARLKRLRQKVQFSVDGVALSSVTTKLISPKKPSETFKSEPMFSALNAPPSSSNSTLTRNPAKPPVTARKKKAAISDSDNEDDDVRVVSATSAPPRSRSARQVPKQPVFVMSSDDEDYAGGEASEASDYSDDD